MKFYHQSFTVVWAKSTTVNSQNIAKQDTNRCIFGAFLDVASSWDCAFELATSLVAFEPSWVRQTRNSESCFSVGFFSVFAPWDRNETSEQRQLQKKKLKQVKSSNTRRWKFVVGRPRGFPSIARTRICDQWQYPEMPLGKNQLSKSAINLYIHSL